MIARAEPVHVGAHVGPVRTCVGCRVTAARGALVRLRRRLDGVAVPEFDPRKGGRSAWVHPSRACLEQAVRRHAIARSLAGPHKLVVRQPPAAELWSAIVEGASTRMILLRRTSGAVHSPRVHALAALQHALQQAGEDA